MRARRALATSLAGLSSTGAAWLWRSRGSTGTCGSGGRRSGSRNALSVSRVVGASGSAVNALAAAESSPRWANAPARSARRRRSSSSSSPCVVVARPCVRGGCCAAEAASLSRSSHCPARKTFSRRRSSSGTPGLRPVRGRGACAAPVRTVSSPCSLVLASVRRECAPGQHGRHCVGALGAGVGPTGKCTRGCGVRLRGPGPARLQGVCATGVRGQREAVAMGLVGGQRRHRPRLVAGRAPGLRGHDDLRRGGRDPYPCGAAGHAHGSSEGAGDALQCALESAASFAPASASCGEL